MKYLFVIVLLLLSGCLATSGDLRTIADKVEQWEQGAITDAELKEALEGQADAIEARTGERLQNIPSDPVELMLWLAGILGASVAGTNAYRNRGLPGATRKEPTK